jgi:hypothetical protein
VLCQQVNDLDRTLPAKAMDASDRLLEPRWVPRGFEIDRRGGELKIESSAASIGGKEHPASRVAIEPLDEFAAPARGDTAVK